MVSIIWFGRVMKNYIKLKTNYNMKAIVRYIGGLCLALICLVTLEGIMTFGHAFEFESYGTFGWVIQGLLILITIWLHMEVVEDEMSRK
jgi:cobalamin biosynthesis protein CobD/CbiB